MHRRTQLVFGGLVVLLGMIGMAGAANAIPPIPFITDANMGNQPTNDRELSIVVDPNDADHLATGANMRGGPNGQRWYVSTDGGRNWTNGALPFGTIASGTNNGTNTLMSDPALDFDSEGDIYYAALAHGGDGDPCDLFVSTSADNGVNWSDPSNGLVADGGASICNDKEFILVKPSPERQCVRRLDAVRRRKRSGVGLLPRHRRQRRTGSRSGPRSCSPRMPRRPAARTTGRAHAPGGWRSLRGLDDVLQRPRAMATIRRSGSPVPRTRVAPSGLPSKSPRLTTSTRRRRPASVLGASRASTPIQPRGVSSSAFGPTTPTRTAAMQISTSHRPETTVVPGPLRPKWTSNPIRSRG